MSKKFKINRMPFIFFLGLLILAIFYALYVEISFAGENSEYFAYSYGELSYKHKVKVTLNSDKKIVKVEDESTVPNPRDQYYWNKYLNGKGFDKFEGLDVEKVKKMEIWKGEFAGKDAVAGATMSSEAVQKAVIYAIGRSRDRAITYNGYYHPDIGEGGVYTLKLDNDLPKDYKPVLEKVTYGIFRSKDAKEIIGLNLSEDGSKITFKEKLKPGYYCLSIKDANNKYPSFDWKIEHANQYIYPEFAFYTGNDGSGVNYENGKISPTSPQLTVEDLRNNVEDIDITDVETNQTVEVPLAHPEEGANTEYINGEYAKNQFFTDEGKINNNFTVNGKKVFMPGKKYKIRVKEIRIKGNRKSDRYNRKSGRYNRESGRYNRKLDRCKKSGVSGFSRYTPDSIRVSLAKRKRSRLECLFYFICRWKAKFPKYCLRWSSVLPQHCRKTDRSSCLPLPHPSLHRKSDLWKY